MKFMDNPDQTNKNALIISATLIVFFSLMALFFLHLVVSGKISPKHPVIASGTFEDGTEAEILAADLSLTQAIENPPKKSFLVNRNSSSTYGRASLDFKTETKNGKLLRSTLISEDPALQLMVRLRKNGHDIIPDFAYILSRDNIAEIKRHPDGYFDKFDRTSLTLESIPNYRVQVEDGAGDWIDMSGPFATAGDGRSMVVSNYYPRTTPELRIRFLLPDPDAKPLEISIPTPGYLSGGLKQWQIEPKPWRRDLAELSIVVNDISFTKSDRNTKIPRPEKEVVDIKNDQPANAFNVNFFNVEDPHGNVSDLYEMILLPGVTELNYMGSATRNIRNYLWNPSQISFVAEGVWTGTENQMPLSLLSQSSEFGLEKMTIKKESAKKWKISFNGSALRVNLPDNWRIIVFVDGESRSAKTSVYNSGSSRHRGAVSVYQQEFTWEHAIAPGQKLQVGFLPNETKETFEMVLPVKNQ